MAVEIAEVLNRYDVKTKGRSSGGEQPYMCPMGHKTFDVNFVKNKWKCFHQCTGCTANGGGAYDLWCSLNGIAPEIDMKPNFRKFCKEFEDNSAAHIEAVKLAEQERAVAPVDSEKADAETCDKAYRAFLMNCKLTQAHRANLAKRGLTPAQVKHFGFKSIPQIGITSMCDKMVAEGIKLEGVPGFYLRSNGKWSFLTSGSGYFIPYKDKDNRVIGLQVRYDINIDGLEGKDLKKAKKMRYRWVTSSGMPSGSSMPLIPYIGEPRGDDKAVYVTEGGLKAMVSAAISARWFAAIPGISCFTVYKELLSHLKEKGITKIVDAWDTDRNTNESVRNSIQKLYSIAEEMGFEVIIWDAFVNGKEKGCDDYLLARRNEKRANRTQT